MTSFSKRWTVRLSIVLCLASGALRAQDENPLPDLLDAAMEGDLEWVRTLLDLGADVNARGPAGETALHHAVAKDRLAVAELLLARRAAVEARDLRGVTPLHLAMVPPFNKDLVLLLLSKGAAINAEDRDGETPLHWACHQDQADGAKFLLARGAGANAKDKKGLTPLHMAAQGGRAGVADALLAGGAKVNPRAPDGSTPLMLAAAAGHRDVVKVLLAGGASVVARDESGRTALDAANANGRPEMVALLRRAGRPGEEPPRPVTVIPAAWSIEIAIDAMRGLDLDALGAQDLRAVETRLDSALKFLRESGRPAARALREAVEKEWAKSPVDSFFLLDATSVLATLLKDKTERTEFARQALSRADPGKSSQDAFNLAFDLAAERRKSDLPALARLLALPEDARAVIFGHAMNLDWRNQQIFVFGVFGAEAMDAVRPHLKDPDPGTRRSAAFVAAIFFDEASAPALRDLLRDPIPAVRREAARALGYVGTPDDAKRLGALLKDDPVDEVRFSAAFALFELGTTEAVAFLARGTEDSVPALRNECVTGLTHYHDAEALKALVVRLGIESDPQVRAAIISGLGEFGTRKTAARIESMLGTGIPRKDPAVERAVRAMLERGLESPLTFPWPPFGGERYSLKQWQHLERQRTKALARLSDEGMGDWLSLTEEMNLLRLEKKLAAREGKSGSEPAMTTPPTPGATEIRVH